MCHTAGVCRYGSAEHHFNEHNNDGTIYYPEAWFPSLETWSDTGLISFATDTVFTIKDLEIASTTASDLTYVGLWTPDNVITLNAFYMDSPSATNAFKQNVIMHELGHALGLGHSYTGNIMHYLVTGTTILGAQDISDLLYASSLWP